MAIAVCDPAVKHGIISQPWWSPRDYQGLNYANEDFNDPASVQHWKSLGYTQTIFTGDMYDMRNIEPAWIDPFRSVFDWDLFSWSVYRMGPGTVLPSHSDIYRRFCSIHRIHDAQQIFRAIVFLEDWQSGHYAEYNGVPFVSWHRGHWVLWQGTTPHAAANIGHSARYTLQITGIPRENPFLQ